MRTAFKCAAALTVSILSVQISRADETLDPAFVGRWVEKASANQCSAVRGFLLEANGAAKVEWAPYGLGAHAVERRDGAWVSSAGNLRVSMTFSLSITGLTANKTETASAKITFDGSLDDSGNVLQGVTGIDGQSLKARCTYIRAGDRVGAPQ